MIEAENISYHIGNKQILQPMSFAAERGEITVLLGANGAGKSSLLRVLAGESKPDQGKVLLNHLPLHQLSPEKLATKRAVLTQNYSVPLPFTCEEIVTMGRYPHYSTSTAAENNMLVQRCMKEMEVFSFAKRIFNTLSGGEQQRVQMARVLAQLANTKDTDESVLLLDEPTSSMDYLQQQLVLSKARTLAAKGYTIIVVLHDLNLAAQYADKILLFKEGYLLAVGPGDEILQSPLISMAYDLDVDVVTHKDYPFPILIPALHNQNRIIHLNKTSNNGTYTKKSIVEK